MLETLDRFVRRTFVRNFHLKVIALLLTLALYLWVSVDREVKRTRYAPLRLDVPAGMVLVNDPPARVGVTLRGKWSDLARLDPAELDSIRVPVDPAMGRQGRVTLSPDMIELPPGLRAIDLKPSVVEFRLEQKRRKTVPVRPRLTGQPNEGYEVEKVTIQPEQLEVSGPAHSLENLMAVSTEPIPLSGHRKSFQKTVRPRINDRLVEYRLETPLEVSVQLDARQVERVFESVEVVANHADGAVVASIKPTAVDVTVRGPKAIIDRLQAGELLASVDLSDVPKAATTTVLREVTIHNIPDDVDLVTRQPSTFRVRIHPVEKAQNPRE